MNAIGSKLFTKQHTIAAPVGVINSPIVLFFKVLKVILWSNKIEVAANVLEGIAPWLLIIWPFDIGIEEILTSSISSKFKPIIKPATSKMVSKLPNSCKWKSSLSSEWTFFYPFSNNLNTPTILGLIEFSKKFSRENFNCL